MNLLIDITTSVAYHGFKRIVLVNGHGSNHPLVEQAARQATLRTGALCLKHLLVAAGSPTTGTRRYAKSAAPVGSPHACELETSMYLHIDGDRVPRKDRIKGALADYLTGLEGGSEWQMADLTLGSGPATIVEWTSATTETGAFVAPELATAGEGAARLRAQCRAPRRPGRLVQGAARVRSARPPRGRPPLSRSRSSSEAALMSDRRFAELGVATSSTRHPGREGLVSWVLSSGSFRARGSPARVARLLCGSGDNLAAHRVLETAVSGERWTGGGSASPRRRSSETSLALQARVRGCRRGACRRGGAGRRRSPRRSPGGLPECALVSVGGAAKERPGALDVHVVTVGGVVIAPGDTVVLDGDGCVVVAPAARVAEVLAAAEARAANERDLVPRLEAGELTLDLMELRRH